MSPLHEPLHGAWHTGGVISEVDKCVCLQRVPLGRNLDGHPWRWTGEVVTALIPALLQ